jgi:hypothetical protein
MRNIFSARLLRAALFHRQLMRAYSELSRSAELQLSGKKIGTIAVTVAKTDLKSTPEACQDFPCEGGLRCGIGPRQYVPVQSSMIWRGNE